MLLHDHDGARTHDLLKMHRITQRAKCFQATHMAKPVYCQCRIQEKIHVMTKHWWITIMKVVSWKANSGIFYDFLFFCKGQSHHRGGHRLVF